MQARFPFEIIVKRLGFPEPDTPKSTKPSPGTRQGSTGAQNPATSVEWPSLFVAVSIYGGFLALTWHFHALPWWAVLPLGAYLLAWHGSLQHEVVHGHPTTKGWINELLVFPSLWLWLPYRIYRKSHLRHHRNSHLTHPDGDPESFYLDPSDWARSGSLRRWLLTAQNTALGRLALGPLLVVARLYRDEALRLARGDFTNLRAWMFHALSCGLVLVWVVGVCRIPLAWYLLLFVYPGLSLTLLRSFAEHQAAAEVGARTAIVEAGPLLSLVFLNNNLHAVHHESPALPWYRLPSAWKDRRVEILRRNGSYHFRGYGEILQRHLLTAKEPVVHPHPPA